MGKKGWNVKNGEKINERLKKKKKGGVLISVQIWEWRVISPK